eukprot:TRINITY_DN44036_c0_g1_i1.p1 TRINITY_DN44036_c0_g1~~TRINITY_DN44036_c0_g1_i1.p1  ORF type:complete len:529 (-),score=100.86 TRINITY_DN44036_c0_g1_i1:59-1645(-)
MTRGGLRSTVLWPVAAAEDEGPSSLAAEPWPVHQGPRLSRRPLVQSSFADVWCPSGFKCVSKISQFGFGHDGTYVPTKKEVPGSPLLDEAYEWGCPARGKVTGDGACLDDGKGGKTLCWSTRRFEGSGLGTPCGPNGENCRCVRPFTAHGTGGEPYRIVADGLEVLEGKFQEALATDCSKCAPLDEASCKACYPTCTMSNKRGGAGDGGDAGGEAVRAKCVPAGELVSSGPADAERKAGRLFNHGLESREVNLKIVPHYRIWDPQEPDDRAKEADGGSEQPGPDGSNDVPLVPPTRMPYEIRREPLSRNAWMKTYRASAPRVQHMLDSMVTQLRDEWSQPGKASTCLGKGGGAAAGDDLNGKLDKFLAVQRSCREMSDIASTLRSEEASADGRFSSQHCGKAHDGTCGCIRVPENGEEPEADAMNDCQALNCYTADTQVQDGIRKLKEKNETCAEEGLADAVKAAGLPPALEALALSTDAPAPYCRQRAYRRRDGLCLCQRRCGLQLRPSLRQAYPSRLEESALFIWG